LTSTGGGGISERIQNVRIALGCWDIQRDAVSDIRGRNELWNSADGLPGWNCGWRLGRTLDMFDTFLLSTFSVQIAAGDGMNGAAVMRLATKLEQSEPPLVHGDASKAAIVPSRTGWSFSVCCNDRCFPRQTFPLIRNGNN
jgi:hypothetical protein